MAQRLDNSGSDRRDQTISRETPFFELMVALLGAALVAGTIGFMIYKAAWGEQSPPDIVITVDSIQPVSNGYLVNFKTINNGGMTAQSLIIEAELSSNNESVETVEVTIDYLPSYSERKGGVFFTNNPRDFELKVRPRSYQRP